MIVVEMRKKVLFFYAPHQSTKKCKYRTLEKYTNTYYENEQNINPACACNTYLINSIILFYLFIFKLCI